MASANGGIIGKSNVPSAQAEIISTFNSSGTLTTGAVTTEVEYLVIAGGGGAGSTVSGGGGAGGYRTASGFSVSSSTAYSITVGAGGAQSNAGNSSAMHGSDSVFSTITSEGGGYGAGCLLYTSPSPRD